MGMCKQKEQLSFLGKRLQDQKKQGGLGVLNLETQNKALLLKNLDRFYNNHDIPCVKLVKRAYYDNGTLPGTSVEGSFWWRDHLKLIHIYKGMAKCSLGDGNQVCFGLIIGKTTVCNTNFPI
jgi:hypothetical protein